MSSLSPTRSRAAVPRASLTDTLALFADVVLPTIAKGVIIRRPWVVGLAERLDLDRRAVRRMQRLRDRHGPGPLLVPLPLRPQAVILSPTHVHRVLTHTPEPFATDSYEKRAALSHFEPHVSLISRGPERADRRRFNERVLESGCPLHHLAARFDAVVSEEAGALLALARADGELAWPEFFTAWFRVVRRVVFGDGAADDEALIDLLERLRGDANWAFLKPRRHQLRRQFLRRVRRYLDRAEPGSLGAEAARTHTTAATHPEHQVPQWLFAAAPAGMAAFRTLAVLATHPDHAARALTEVMEPGQAERPFLRACVLDTLRLWPTTPAVLRETTRRTRWETGTLAAGTGIFIYAPFFHRDDQRLPFADTFAPEVWLHERTPSDWPLIPFSEGPAVCPARELVLLLTTAMIAALLRDHELRLLPPDRLTPGGPLPGTLDNYSLRFQVRPRGGDHASPPA